MSAAVGRPRALVVDDSEGMREVIVGFLDAAGWDADTAEDGRRGLALLEAGAAPDLVLLDVMLPELAGLEVLRRMREFAPDLPVVMLSVVGTASTIVEAMRLGALDYLNKPFDEDDLEQVLERARSRRSAQKADPGLEGPLLEGAAWDDIRAVLEQIKDTDVSVLIQGESGVGKEVVARAIHESSSRRG
ncbi:MAG: response regulator, partial [Myxococcota bacterium]|nr:response regulator [Myxococcota bacterium]